VFCLRHKIGCHRDVSKGIKKEVRIEKIHANTFHLVSNIVKIGPVDPEIICLKLKNEEINASKIYSSFGKFAEWANKC